MRTEHLQNVHLGWVTAGWLIAAAVTSLVVMALAGLGVVAPDGSMAAVWSIVAVIIGFYIGGMFTGFRSPEAPILHGIAIGIFSLVAWLVINAVVSLAFRGAGWAALTPTAAAAGLLLQMAAAVAGALTGRAIELRGGPDVTD
jgi:hypothetical protein